MAGETQPITVTIDHPIGMDPRRTIKLCLANGKARCNPPPEGGSHWCSHLFHIDATSGDGNNNFCHLIGKDGQAKPEQLDQAPCGM